MFSKGSNPRDIEVKWAKTLFPRNEREPTLKLSRNDGLYIQTQLQPVLFRLPIITALCIELSLYLSRESFFE